MVVVEPVRNEHLPCRRLGFARGCAQAPKVVLAPKQARGLVERGAIEIVWVVEREPRAKRQRHRSPIKVVAIGFRPSAVASMELRWCFLDMANADVFREHRVQPASQAVGRDRVLQLKMGSLTKCMNTCIGTPGRNNVHRRLRHARQCLSQPPLNRVPLELHLPPPIGGPIVGKQHFVERHGGSS